MALDQRAPGRELGEPGSGAASGLQVCADHPWRGLSARGGHVFRGTDGNLVEDLGIEAAVIAHEAAGMGLVQQKNSIVYRCCLGNTDRATPTDRPASGAVRSRARPGPRLPAVQALCAAAGHMSSAALGRQGQRQGERLESQEPLGFGAIDSS